MTTDRTRDGQRQRHAWAGGLIGILVGVAATVGLLVAGGEGIALGAAFGAAAGVLAAAVLTMRAMGELLTLLSGGSTLGASLAP